jgi:hypothetical protein
MFASTNIFNNSLAPSFTKTREEMKETIDKKWTAILQEFKYDSFHYMKEKLKFSDELINNINSYYSETLATYLLSNTQNISEYRKKLSYIINDKILINCDGNIIFKDKYCQENEKIFQNSFYSMNINGVFNYLRLSYKEDLLLDKLYNKTKTVNSIKNSLHKSNFSFSFPNHLKSFFNEYKNEVDKPELLIKFKELYDTIVYKNTVYFIGIAEYNDIEFPIKLICSKTDSGINLVLSKMKNDEIKVIRLMDKNSFLFYENLNGSQFFVVKSGWIIEL